MATRIAQVFGNAGDLTTVPDQSVGTELSFEQGWSPAYSLPAGAPGYRYIDRAQHNYLWNAVTGNVKQWQEQAYPQWFSNIDYPIGAKVRRNDLNYEKNANNDGVGSEPGSSADWIVINELSAKNELLNGSLFSGSNGRYIQNGDVIPEETTHIYVLISGKPTILIAWDSLTLPATVTTVPSSDNGLAGYNVITEQGTFEFVTESIYNLRGFEFAGRKIASPQGWGAVLDGVNPDDAAYNAMIADGGADVYAQFSGNALFTNPVSFGDDKRWFIDKDAKVTKDPSLMNDSFIILGDDCVIDGFGTIDGNYHNMDKPNNTETIGNAVRVGARCLVQDVTMINTESSHIASSGLNTTDWGSGLRVKNVAFGDFVDHCVYCSGKCDDIDVQARYVKATNTSDNPREAFKVRGEIGNVTWRDCPYVDIPGTRGNLFSIEVDAVTANNKFDGTVTIRNFPYVNCLYNGQCFCTDTTTELGTVIEDNVNFIGVATQLSELREPVRSGSNLYGFKRLILRNSKFHNVLPQSFYQKDSFSAEPNYHLTIGNNEWSTDYPLLVADIPVSSLGGVTVKYEYFENTVTPDFTTRFTPGHNVSVLHIKENVLSRISELVYPVRSVETITIESNRDLIEANRAPLDVSGIAGLYTIDEATFDDNVFRHSNTASGLTIGVLAGTVTNLNNDPNGNTILYTGVNLRVIGTTAERPSSALVGFRYFDTTLGKPVWFVGGGVWNDATGSPS